MRLQLKAGAAALLPALAFLAMRTRAEDAGTFEMKNALYTQKDGSHNRGGNRAIDEDESVFESIILVTHPVGARDTFRYRLLSDIISSASIRRDHNQQFSALQSGASGNTNLSAGAGWTRRIGEGTVGAEASTAREYAYESIGYGVNAGRDLFDGLGTLTGRVNAFNDTVHTIRFNGSEGEREDRDTLTAEVGWTQPLTPRSQVTVSLGHTEQHGFLATSYNSVFVNGAEDYEILPSSRTRDSATARYRTALGEQDACETGYRFYTDDWGIRGHTLETRYLRYVRDRTVILEPHYRLHVQSEADAYRPRFSAAQRYQTSDPDLGDFTGHTVGLKTTLLSRHFLTERDDWDLDLAYSTRNDGLTMWWVMLGCKIPL